MPRTNSSPSAGSTVVDKLKTYEGGTGQTTAVAALAALGGVPASSINQPNGVAGLDANQKLLPAVLPVDNLSVVSVQGVTSLIKGLTATFTITNYDAFATYALVAISGTVTRVNETITYTAPGAAGAGGFTLNGRQFPVTIADYAPQTPVLAGTHYGGQGSNVVAALTGSAFLMVGNSDTHLNTDWQIATDAAFTNVVAQSLADATNKTTWTYPTLALTTTYYARCRYRSSGNFVSAYSNVLSFTTKSSYVLNVEEAIVAPADLASGDKMGDSASYWTEIVALSSDGTRMILGVGNQDNTSPALTDTGAAYIFVRSGSTWTQEQKLVSPDRTLGGGGDFFGQAVAISSDGTRVVVTAPYTQNTSADNNGSAYVWVRNTTTNVWTQEQKLTADTLTSATMFGIGVAMSGNGLRIAVYCYQQGAVYVFLRTGVTWAQEQKITSGGGYTFGRAISITDTGDRIVVGSGDASGYVGNAFVLVRSGVTWAFEAGLVPTVAPVQYDNYGGSVSISGDGTRCAVSSPNYYTGSTIKGKVTIFLRTGSAWAQEAVLQDAALSNGSHFGSDISLNTDATVIAIGAPNRNNVTPYPQGVGYSFKRTGTSWAVSSTVQGSVKVSNDQFGQGAAITGDGSRMVMVAPNANGNRGRAFVFTS